MDKKDYVDLVGFVESGIHSLVRESGCDVSIILATKDRADLLDQMLTSLEAAADGIRYEVIVIEGSSSDATPAVLQKHNITQIYNEAQHLGPGRHSWPQLYNFGFSKACGKWAMFASDDIVLGKGSIRHAVELLNQQKDEVAGGIFFYKNFKADSGWDKFGIDFTDGPKLLLNYGLIRLKDFRLVRGFDETYKFYCADTDLCYKLYQSGRQLIPLPGCFLIHNNVLDVQKKVNVDNSSRDIELYKQKWKHFVSMQTPKPRRLLWQDEYLTAFLLPIQLQQINSSIEYFWQGLSCLQQGMPRDAMLRFQQAIQFQCDHWIVLWFLARSAYECKDVEIARKSAQLVLKLMHGFKQAQDMLAQISTVSCPEAMIFDVPMVSIYMSMYNTGRYLSETLDSILSQTFKNWELVIVDDGSEDNSLDVAYEYQRRDSRIRVFSIPHVGVVGARNEALKQCNPRSKYLMNHDSDDISLPDKLRRLVEYLDNNSQIAIVGCFAEYFGEGSVGKKPPYLEWQPQRIRQTFGEFNSMIHSAAMMRHEVVQKIGFYRDNYPPAEDYEFFALALMAGFECANIPEVLHRIRLHRKSLSAVHTQIQQAHAETIKANYRRYLKATYPLPVSHASSKPSLSILHTVEFYAPHTGGAEEVVRQLSERLVKRGHSVTVATTKLSQRNFNELNGVRIKEFDIAGNMVRGFQGTDAGRYRDLVCSDRFDVMFNYAAQQWATDLAFASLESTSAKRVNVIAPCGFSALRDARTLRLEPYTKYFNTVIPTCLPRYDAAVYHSAMYKDYEYAQIHGFRNSIVIPNGTAEDEFLTRPDVDFRRKYGITTKYLGLCVANFYPGKGHQRIVDAVRQMNRPDFTLVFIGKEGELLPEIKKLAEGLNIRFCVNIPREDTVAAYHGADLFLFGSEIEASPLVIMEAKASRTPFISTDCGNVRELKGGVVCTPEKIAFCANTLLDNEQMRKNLAETGWKEWKEKFTWESVVDRYETLFLDLKKAKQRGMNNDFNNIQQRPSYAAAGDPRVVPAAL